ncbi:ABC transporter permease [Undibacterium pigrum]|uniref:Putative ABC transport system permease protein n=1 Tax=Undibacterium pigrum TaxID=401470 RepID=A0A318JBB1_9BURK|nr:ABC transporter permease [Undibacterium pigrum]PXX45347.1 putative ABC transport system permease protein [Undibacterium pigrum]
MLKNYFQIACKVYMRRKLFTAINLLCIVLTMVVLLVVTAILQATFYPTGVEGRSDRFLQIGTLTITNKNSVTRTPLGYKIIDQYLRKMKTVEKVAGVTGPESVSVYQKDSVNEIMMRRADAEYWQILDFKILSGRVPTDEDVKLGRFVAVINESTAKKLFGPEAALGKKINTSGQQFEIIGVVDDVLHLNAYADIWVPVTTFPSSQYREQFSGNFTAMLMGKSPADLALIKDELLQVVKQINADDPRHWDHTYMWADGKLDFFARNIMSHDDRADSGAAQLLAGIVMAMLLFMLLPALNLINLNSGRIMERAAEIGVRKAFGANNSELVRQFVMENILLCLFGGVLGLIFTKLTLVWLSNANLVPYMKVDLSFMVFAYGFAIAVVFGVLSGVIPAWKMSRLDPVLALKGAA